jgi:hypothetical protein
MTSVTVPDVVRAGARSLDVPTSDPQDPLNPPHPVTFRHRCRSQLSSCRRRRSGLARAPEHTGGEKKRSVDEQQGRRRDKAQIHYL